jgi:hypothetical protein
MDAMVRLLGQPGTATDPELLAGLVHACRYCGLLDESVAAHDRARRLDPIVRTSVAQTHWVRRDFQRALDADIDNPSHVTVLSVEGMGRVTEAIALVSTVLTSLALPQTPRVFLSAFRAMFEGDRQAALAAVERCLQLPFQDPEGIYRMAWMLARLRQDDAALATLRRAVEGGFWCPFHLRSDPWFEPLQGTSEFAEILGLAQEKQSAARRAFVTLGGDELLKIAS